MEKPTESNPAADKPTESHPDADKPNDSKPATDKPNDSKPTTDKPNDSKPATDEPTDAKPVTGEPDKSNPVTEEAAKPRPLMELQVSKPIVKLGALMDIPINPFWLNQSNEGPEWRHEEDLFESDDNFQSFYDKPFRGQPNRRPYRGKPMNPYKGPSWSDEETETYPYINESDPYEFDSPQLMGQPMKRRAHLDQPYGARPFAGQPIRRRPSQDRQMDHRPYPGPPVDQRSVDPQNTIGATSSKPVSLMDLNFNPKWKSQSSSDWSY